MVTPVVRKYLVPTEKNPLQRAAEAPSKSVHSKDTIEKIEKEATTTSFFSDIINWFWGLFYPQSNESQKSAPDSDSHTVDPAITKHRPKLDKPSDFSMLQMNEKLRQTSELNASIKDINDEGHDYTKKIYDPYELSSEFGLDKAWVKAQMDQITIRKEFNLYTDQELLKLNEVLQNIRKSIDDVLQERIKNKEKGKILGILDIGTLAFAGATLIVMTGMAAAIGTANIPAILLLIQAGATLAGGGVTLFKGLNRFDGDKLQATLFGSRDDRLMAISSIKDRMEIKEDQTHMIEMGYKLLRDMESNRAQTIRDR